MPASKLWILCAISLLCEPARSAPPDETSTSVTVSLRSGRNVAGVIDQRTDHQRLWLRRTFEGFDLSSGFAWTEVLQAQAADNQHFDAEQLRAWAKEVKQPGRQFADIGPLVRTQAPTRDKAPAAHISMLKTLLISAHVAQWDKDAQPDGVRIIVSPLDSQGRLVPVDGHIEFTLVAQHEPFNGGRTRTGRPEFLQGDRFSYLVKREHFIDGPALYELPFTKWHPDFRPELSPQALLHARLSVPGRGVFEASDAQLCLREVSWFRDQLQYFTPGRYLPLESNGQANR